MTKEGNKRRVLLIGAGRRIQNNFLPALTCLGDHFQVVGIHSRTPARLAEVADHWGIPPEADLANFDFSKTDIVAVSVPTSQNANVLRAIQEQARTLDLVIDTPLAWDAKEHAEISPLLAKFRSVTVTEDYMNFPRFCLARDIVRKGLIGELRSLTLYNIGYLYHGLALIRSFMGFGPVLKSWSRKIGRRASVVVYEFEGDFSASVVGPYRRHTSGGLLVEGTAGIITEFPIDGNSVPGGTQAYVLSKVMTDGFMSGVSVRGEKQCFTLELPDMIRMRGMKIADKSELNLERGCGLISVFRSFLDLGNLNRNYSAADAFYDCFVSRRAESGELPLDPFDTFRLRQKASGATSTWVAKSETF